MTNACLNSRPIAAMLLSTCFLSGLVGCSGANQQANSTPQSGQSSPIATTAPGLDIKTEVEQAIAEYLPKEIGVPLKSVTCPSQVSLAPGNGFDCKVQIAAGTFPVNVMVKDANGNLTLKTRQILLLPEAEKELQQSIQQREKIDVKADCGEKVKIPKKVGEKVECKLTDKTGKTGTATLTVTSKEGKVDAKWKF